MQSKKKGISIVLMSTVTLGALAILPVGEVQAKAAISQQAKATSTKKTATVAKQTATETTAAATNQAIATQLAAKGINYNRLNRVQQQDAYVDVIVQMSAAPASENGTLKTDYSSTAEIQQQSNKVIAAQASVKAAVQQVTQQAIGESYGYVVNGFTTKVRVSDIPKLEQIAGVKTVTLAKVYYPTDAKANSMANVQAVWSNYKYKGEGTVVSVIDTGIDPNHKDMRLSNAKTAKLSQSDVAKFTKTAKHGKYFTDKVPYGFNYADNNNTITDDTVDEQHGMHVAGIVGANGTGDDPTTSVVGVAPESQLLAMKVFTNSDTSATTGSSTLVSAIEDSAKLGADVLNMSLGSVSGNQTLQDPEIAAVKNANDSGTAAVISAGNNGASGSSTDGVNKDYFGLDDNETVGTPGTSRGATTVASAENTDVIGQAVTITDGSKLKLGPESIQLSSNDFTGSFNGKKFAVVKDSKGGLSTGAEADYANTDVKGKIAIVQRGVLPFTDKQKYAEAAGAAGLIIVNNDGTATPLTKISLTATFPTFGLSNVVGQKLVDWVTAHPDDSLNVKIALALLPNQEYTNDRMSSFTSYGPVSDLSFKPDITAPGGNIWSTQNNNSYTNLSGTSMASPFIAGSQALLKQAISNKKNSFYTQYQQLKGSTLTDFLKTIEMNTAAPINDVNHKNVIVSPRRQGAGLVDVKAAIDALEKNPSTVVSENGYPAVELKDFTSNSKTFKLTFTNRTKHQLTYQMDNNEDTNAVYTSATDQTDGTLYDKKIDGASIKPASTIVVPAGKSVSVAFNLTIPKNFDQQQFVEGFLNFKGSDGSRLNLPYMGFYGDWDNESIVDPLNGPAFDPTGKLSSAQVPNYATMPILSDRMFGYQFRGGLVKDAKGNYKIDPDAVALSTTEDAVYNKIAMQYYLLRNISQVKVQVLDSQGKLVTTLSTSTNQTKTYYDSNSGSWVYYHAPSWDGTYYNQQNGKIETVADGTYTYRLTGTPEGGNKPQTYDVKFKVDSKAPELRNLDLTQKTKNGKTQYYLTAEAKDDFSGLDVSGNAQTSVNQVTNIPTTFTTTGKTADGYTKVETALTDEQAKTIAAGDNAVEFSLYDNASNAGELTANVQKPGSTSYGLVLNDGGLTDKITSQADGYSATNDKEGTYSFSGTYPEPIYGTYTDAKGKQHDLTTSYDATKNSFSAKMTVSAGDYTTKVDLYSDKAHTHLIKHADVAVRLVAPTFTNLVINKGLDQTSETKIPVSGTVSADTTKVAISTDSGSVTATLDKNHKFTAEVPVSYGANSIEVTAVDADGNQTSEQKNITSTNDPDVLKNAVTFDNNVSFGSNQVTVGTSKYYDAKTGIATITGKVKHPTTTLQVDGKQVPIKSDQTFSFTLNLGKAGQKPFGVVVGDSTQNKTFQESLTFILDAVPPTLSLDQSTDKPIYTNDPAFKITGTATDNVNSLSLSIDGSNVYTSYDDVDLNSGQPGKLDINQSVQLLEGKNVLTVAATDSGNNVTTKKITVYYEPKKTLASPTVTPSTTAPAKSVTLTAKAAGTGETVKYSQDNGKTYQDVPAAGVNVTANGTFLFKSTDPYGNESSVVTYDLKNIQTVDPAQVQAAKTALQNLITQAQSKQVSETFTDASKQALTTAIQAAQKALSQSDASIDSLTAATTALQTAINQLATKLPADQQAALLNQLQSVKDLFGTDLGGLTDTATGKTFTADVDSLTQVAKAGTATADEIKADINQILNAALSQLANDITNATPATVASAKNPATGNSWASDVATALNTGKAASDPSSKMAQVQRLQALKTAVAAAVKAAEQGNGGSIGSNTGNGGSTGSNTGSGSSTGSNTGNGGSTGSNTGNGGSTGSNSGNGSSTGSNTGNGGSTGSDTGNGGSTGSDTGSGSSTGSNTGNGGSAGSNTGNGGSTGTGTEKDSSTVKDHGQDSDTKSDDTTKDTENPTPTTGSSDTTSSTASNSENQSNGTSSATNKMPGTGEQQNGVLAFVGTLMLGLAGILRFAYKRMHQNE